MKKFLVQFLFSLTVFFTVFFAFSKIDWMQRFNLYENTTEQKQGTWFWKAYLSGVLLLEDKAVLLPLDSILTHLCKANQIDRSTIKLHVVRSNEINAFACLGRRMLICSSLTSFCCNKMELCGVIAHEVSHVEKGHVMQKLKKEMGIAILLGMVSGDDTQVMEVMKVFSSTAYDRLCETKADKRTVEYLQQASVGPRYFGAFLNRISEHKKEVKLLDWTSTQPDSEKRNKHILCLLRNRKEANTHKKIIHKSTSF